MGVGKEKVPDSVQNVVPLMMPRFSGTNGKLKRRGVRLSINCFLIVYQFTGFYFLICLLNTYA